MKTRRWFELAAALVLGVLIGYGVARSTSSDVSAPPGVSARHYTVGSLGSSRISNGGLYRYDTHTGKTWLWWISGSGYKWREIAEPNQGVSPPNEKN